MPLRAGATAVRHDDARGHQLNQLALVHVFARRRLHTSLSSLFLAYQLFHRTREFSHQHVRFEINHTLRAGSQAA